VPVGNGGHASAENPWQLAFSAHFWHFCSDLPYQVVVGFQHLRHTHFHFYKWFHFAEEQVTAKSVQNCLPPYNGYALAFELHSGPYTA
jgi:hypothetical protein